jgi:succinyl-diaminopimelate desuccinylase
MSSDNVENIFKAVDERRDELVELTRALIRFPTVNPPGEAYRPCAEFIGARMRTRGFAVDYVHAAGTPGDNEDYPRINVIARRSGEASGPCGFPLQHSRHFRSAADHGRSQWSGGAQYRGGGSPRDRP